MFLHVRFLKAGRRPRTSRRRALAAVETALVFPVLLMLVYATLTAAHLIYFRKSMVVAAAEGVRLASRRNSDDADVEQRIRQVLSSRRIENAEIRIEPVGIDLLEPGELITVRVEADYRGLGMEPFGLELARRVGVRAAILRE